MTIDYTIRNSNNRIYRIFKAMKTRCYNKNSSWYKYYGAKGVTICDEWLSDSMKFILWALDNGYEENLTIDRINVDGQYSPNKWSIEKALTIPITKGGKHEGGNPKR